MTSPYYFLRDYAALAMRAYPRTMPEDEWRRAIGKAFSAQTFAGGDTQGFICQDRGRTIVSFRGTEISSIEDILTDVSAWPKALACRSKVHQGAYDGVGQVLKEILYHLEARKDTPIDIIGHSLGGMKAQILAHLLMKQGFQLGRLVTFGSPPAGNQAFSSSLCTVYRNEFIRVVRCADIVPRLKVLWAKGYRHANGLYYIDRKGRNWWAPSSNYQVFDRLTAKAKELRPLSLDLAHHDISEYHNILGRIYS